MIRPDGASLKFSPSGTDTTISKSESLACSDASQTHPSTSTSIQLPSRFTTLSGVPGLSRAMTTSFGALRKFSSTRTLACDWAATAPGTAKTMAQTSNGVRE